MSVRSVFKWVLPVAVLLVVELSREIVLLNALGVEPGKFVRDVRAWAVE